MPADTANEGTPAKASTPALQAPDSRNWRRFILRIDRFISASGVGPLCGERRRQSAAFKYPTAAADSTIHAALPGQPGTSHAQYREHRQPGQCGIAGAGAKELAPAHRDSRPRRRWLGPGLFRCKAHDNHLDASCRKDGRRPEKGLRGFCQIPTIFCHVDSRFWLTAITPVDCAPRRYRVTTCYWRFLFSHDLARVWRFICSDSG